MTAKEYLSRAFYLRLQISDLDLRIEEIRHRMSSVGAIRYDKLNVQSSPDDPLVSNISRLIDAEHEILRLEAEYSELCSQIRKKLDQLDSEIYRTILAKRYLYAEPIRKIADEIHYSEGYVRILHTAALHAFEKVM